MLAFCTQICQQIQMDLFQIASNVNYISNLKCVMKPHFLFHPPYLISAFFRS